MLATLNGHVDALRLLIATAPELAAAVDEYNSTYTEVAAQEGNTDCLKLLLEVAPASATAPSDEGITPVHIAAMQGHDAALELLLAAAPEGAMVLNDKGATPRQGGRTFGLLGRIEVEMGKVFSCVPLASRIPLAMHACHACVLLPSTPCSATLRLRTVKPLACDASSRLPPRQRLQRTAMASRRRTWRQVLATWKL